MEDMSSFASGSPLYSTRRVFSEELGHGYDAIHDPMFREYLDLFVEITSVAKSAGMKKIKRAPFDAPMRLYAEIIAKTRAHPDPRMGLLQTFADYEELSRMYGLVPRGGSLEGVKKLSDALRRFDDIDPGKLLRELRSRAKGHHHEMRGYLKTMGR